jgi:hypothetical protein
MTNIFAITGEILYVNINMGGPYCSPLGSDDVFIEIGGGEQPPPKNTYGRWWTEVLCFGAVLPTTSTGRFNVSTSALRCPSLVSIFCIFNYKLKGAEVHRTVIIHLTNLEQK